MKLIPQFLVNAGAPVINAIADVAGGTMRNALQTGGDLAGDIKGMLLGLGDRAQHLWRKVLENNWHGSHEGRRDTADTDGEVEAPAFVAVIGTGAKQLGVVIASKTTVPAVCQPTKTL